MPLYVPLTSALLLKVRRCAGARIVFVLFIVTNMYIYIYYYICIYISIIRFLCNIQVLFCLIILFEKYCFLDSYNVQFYNPQLGIDTLLRSLIFGILQLAPVQYLWSCPLGFDHCLLILLHPCMVSVISIRLYYVSHSIFYEPSSDSIL